MPYTVPDDDAIDLFAIVQAGIKAKLLQAAYFTEREDYRLVAIIKEQIAYGESVLTALEHACALPNRQEMYNILKELPKREPKVED